MRWYLRCLLTVALASASFCSDLPNKTRLEVRLNETLGSDTSQTGQSFTATLDRVVSVGGKVILPKGARVEGVVALAESTRNYSRPGEIDLRVTSVQAGGQTYDVVTDPVILHGNMGRLDPNTGEPDPKGRRKQEATQAAIDTATGGTRADTHTIPGTSISVGPGTPGMQVLLPARSKLTFTVTAADKPTQER